MARVSLIVNNYTLEIPSNPYPMYPYPERLNYISLDTATGAKYTVNLGPTRICASIVWKAIHYDVMHEYEEFLLKKIELGLKSFKITCPDYIDLGKGKGHYIENAYFNGSYSLKDIISPRENGMFYDIELPYMFVKDEEN